MAAVRTIGIVVVTVGFIGLIELALARAVPPAFVCAYVAFFLGWETYSRAARADACYRRHVREAKGQCLRCGYDLTGAGNVCPECGDGDRTDPSTAAYRELLAASRALAERVHRFRERPFPADWSAAVNGVALAPFTMRAERSLAGMSRLPRMCRFKLSELWANGEPKATAAALYADLHPLLGQFDLFLPALPPDALQYFGDLRSLVADAVALAERWWGDDAVGAEHWSPEPVR